MNPWESPQFTAWVDAVFRHTVSEPEWYWDDNFDKLWTASERPPTDTVELLRLLFSQPAPLLTRYTNDQIAQGIWFIAGEASPGRLCYALIDDSVQLDTRVRCIREIYTLFRGLFAVACNGPARLGTARMRYTSPATCGGTSFLRGAFGTVADPSSMAHALRS